MIGKEQFDLAKEMLAEFIRVNYRKQLQPEYAKEWIRYFNIFKSIVDSVFERNKDESLGNKIKEIKKLLVTSLPKIMSDYFCNGIDKSLLHQ